MAIAIVSAAAAARVLPIMSEPVDHVERKLQFVRVLHTVANMTYLVVYMYAIYCLGELLARTHTLSSSRMHLLVAVVKDLLSRRQ